VRDDIESLIEDLGAHLVSFKVLGGKRSKVLEVHADTEQGIDADLLANISRALSLWLDTSEVISGDYRLIVSSPGLENPLIHGWQYLRHIGKVIHIVLGEDDLAEHLDGVIQGFENNTVSIKSGKDLIDIPLDTITSAKIVPSLK
jgi:ribosome maturation factor RimP